MPPASFLLDGAFNADTHGCGLDYTQYLPVFFIVVAIVSVSVILILIPIVIVIVIAIIILIVFVIFFLQ